jgi:hypothetical protein
LTRNLDDISITGGVHLSLACSAGFAHATRKTEFGNLQKWDAPSRAYLLTHYY